MAALLFVLAVPLVVGWLCLIVKIGFMVADATERSGFDAGFYMMTVCGLLAATAGAVYAAAEALS